MKLRVTVNADGNYFSGGASIVVAEPLVEAFKPMKTADDPLVAAIYGGWLPGSHAEQRVVRLRAEAAKEIAAALTEHLMHEMSRLDTYNGYPKASQSADVKAGG